MEMIVVLDTSGADRENVIGGRCHSKDVCGFWFFFDDGAIERFEMLSRSAKRRSEGKWEGIIEGNLHT